MSALRCSNRMNKEFPPGVESHTYVHSLTHSLALISSLWCFCLLINAENITTISSFPISIPAELTREREELRSSWVFSITCVCGIYLWLCVYAVCQVKIIPYCQLMSVCCHRCGTHFIRESRLNSECVYALCFGLIECPALKQGHTHSHTL